MVLVKCSEGTLKIPKFAPDIDECPTEYENYPHITFTLPEECCPDYLDEDCCGFFTVSLKDLFEDYYNTYWKQSHGEFTPNMINLLREYADKLETDLNERLRNE